MGAGALSLNPEDRNNNGWNVSHQGLWREGFEQEAASGSVLEELAGFIMYGRSYVYVLGNMKSVKGPVGKVLAVKPDSMSLILRTQKVEGKTRTVGVFCCPHGCCDMCECPPYTSKYIKCIKNRVVPLRGGARL